MVTKYNLTLTPLHLFEYYEFMHIPEDELHMCTLTYHHGGKGDSLAELSLNELGHKGGEASQQRCLVDLGQNYQQVDGASHRLQGNTRKT